MDNQLIDRVRSIIADSGKTQREIAEAIGMDAPKLTKSIKGDRNFSSYELAALAELGGKTVDWLLDGKEPRVFTFAHRSLVAEPTIADLAGQEIVAVIGERFDSALRLGILPVPPQLPQRVSGGTDVQRGLALASAATARLAVSVAELSNWELANKIEDEFGVHVVVAELPDRVDGLSFQDGDFRIIVLDSTEKVGRQRFTLAHEFGHILMGDAERLHEAPMNSSAQVSAERKANAFAAAFLAPEAEVRFLLGEGSGEAEFDRLAWQLWLAPDALSWRLLNLRLISEEARPQLGARSQAASARAIGKEDEHLRRSIETKVLRPPARLTDAYLKAFIAGEVAARPVTQLTGLSEGALRSMLDDFAGLVDQHGPDWDDLV